MVLVKGREEKQEKGVVELKRIYLESPNSRRCAFYHLFLFELEDGGYLVAKKSGAAGRVLNERSWRQQTQEEAEKLFARKIRQKTSPNLKSRRRHYQVIQQLSLFA
jgi:hypothetical protein